MKVLIALILAQFAFSCSPGPKIAPTAEDIRGIRFLGYRAPCASNPNDLGAVEVNDDRYEMLLSDVLNNVYRLEHYDAQGLVGYWKKLDKGIYTSNAVVNCTFRVSDGGVIEEVL